MRAPDCGKKLASGGFFEERVSPPQTASSLTRLCPKRLLNLLRKQLGQRSTDGAGEEHEFEVTDPIDYRPRFLPRCHAQYPNRAVGISRQKQVGKDSAQTAAADMRV